MTHLIAKYTASVVLNHFDMSFNWKFVLSFECTTGMVCQSLQDMTMALWPLQ